MAGLPCLCGPVKLGCPHILAYINLEVIPGTNLFYAYAQKHHELDMPWDGY